MAMASRAWEQALYLAAQCCQDFQTAAEPLFLFRTAYARLSAENLVRLAEFNKGIGVPISMAACADNRSEIEHLPHSVDVIIPVHNGLSHLKNCLASIHKYQCRHLGKLVIVDDGSDVETQDFVRNYCRELPSSLAVRLDPSLGFTQAVVAGLGASEAPYFIALNSDTIVQKDWIAKLLSAARAAPNVAIVGPVSNAAAWQNVSNPLDYNGNFKRHTLTANADLAEMQRCTAIASGQLTPESPLVHGFCALVQRKAYDQIGGLDMASFPRGYGEFQDLSIRLWDAGYRAKIATDCFVAHWGAGSIDLDQRAHFSVAGRAKLYEKHTALKYLGFEVASLFSAEMAIFRENYAANLGK